jgi:hypothetical protein
MLSSLSELEHGGKAGSNGVGKAGASQFGVWNLELVAWALSFSKIDPGKACWRTAPMGKVTAVA